MDPSLETLRQQRDKLYRDAQNQPDSEAHQMVQILLLSAMSNQQPEAYHEQFGDSLARERRGYREARARRAQERRGAPLGEEEEEIRAGVEASGDETPESEADALGPEMRLQTIAQALEHAEAAAESGKGMDPLAVYKRIAQIVGLTPPPELTGSRTPPPRASTRDL
jgi:predicted transposase YdaD